MELLSLKNGWYKLSGDGNKESPAARNIVGLRLYCWVYVECGQVIGATVANKESWSPVADKLPFEAVHISTLSSVISGGIDSPIALLKLTHAPLFPLCKHNGKPTGYNQDILVSPVKHDNVHVLFKEWILVKDTAEKIRSDIRKKTREWPVCGHGGIVDVSPVLDRENGWVSGYWHCTCGE